MLGDDIKMGVGEIIQELYRRKRRGNMRIAGKIYLECAHCGKKAEAEFDSDYDRDFYKAIELLYKANGFDYSPFTPKNGWRVDWSDVMLCDRCVDEIMRLYDANLEAEREFLGLKGEDDAV